MLLLQTHLCVPEASFPAHLAGVVAGLLRAYALEPGGAHQAAAGNTEPRHTQHTHMPFPSASAMQCTCRQQNA